MYLPPIYWRITGNTKINKQQRKFYAVLIHSWAINKQNMLLKLNWQNMLSQICSKDHDWIYFVNYDLYCKCGIACFVRIRYNSTIWLLIILHIYLKTIHSMSSAGTYCKAYILSFPTDTDWALFDESFLILYNIYICYQNIFTNYLKYIFQVLLKFHMVMLPNISEKIIN